MVLPMYPDNCYPSSRLLIVECSLCDGSGVAGEPAPYSADGSGPARPALEADGWVTCPWCDRRFSLKDGAVWSGLRHVKCGGRLLPTPNDAAGTLARPWFGGC